MRFTWPKYSLYQLTCLFISFYAAHVQATVVLDGTLGPANTLVGPDFEIAAELGQQRGGNLFHSFETFDLKNTESATFLGDQTVKNIISRITGGAYSKINGKISAVPDADLYLINPYGFSFGPDVEFDLTGSLHITTASQLQLGEGGFFSAKPTQTSVLVSAPPTAFGFLDPTPAAIEVKSNSEISISQGKTLSILGGEVTLDSGFLRATTGRINLAAVTSAQQLILIPTGIQIDGQAKLGAIILKNGSEIDTGKTGGAGHIYIRSGQLQLEESKIFAKTRDEDGGVIAIQVDALTLSNRAEIDSGTFGAGQGGQIMIQVSGKATLSEQSKIETAARRSDSPAGNAGNIFFQANCLTLENNSTISTTTFGPGRGGNITLEITDTLHLADDSTVSAGSKDVGDAGHITLIANHLSMNHGAVSTAAEKADGGNIFVKSQSSLTLDHSQISTTVSGGLGNGGNVAISNPRFFRLQASQVSANANEGNGGIILIVADELIESKDSAIEASSKKGLDGEVKVDTPDVDVNTLPVEFLDASILIKEPCIVQTNVPFSRFILASEGGLPNAPEDLQAYLPALCCYPLSAKLPPENTHCFQDKTRFCCVCSLK